MKLSKLVYILLFVTSITTAQQAKDTLTVQEQFDRIYRISSSYQEYKVVKKTTYQELKNNVLDSLNKIKKESASKDAIIESKKDSITQIKQVYQILEADVNQLIAEKNSISLLGFSLSKSQYSIFVWSIILILAILLSVFVFRFSNSNIVTKKAKEDLQELEDEFNTHKKKSLDREQKLRRQLQDEINKQRGI